MTVELQQTPSLRRLYARGALGSAAAIGRRATVAPEDLPAAALAVRGLRPDADHLTAYQQLVGEPVSDALPAGFVHVLAFPVATALMVGKDFPLPLLGMVHLANRVTQHRAIGSDAELDVRVHAEGLRAHRRGAAVDVVAEVSVADDVVWRGVSTYLAKGVRVAAVGEATGDDAVPTAEPDRPEFAAPVPTGQWRLGADIGRRYAAVSGDHNPIHTSRVAARAFGFPRRIAHGMYTAARALADVGPSARGSAFVWEVEFARPVLLPSTVAVRIANDDAASPENGFRVAAWNPHSGKPHLFGAVRPLAPAPEASRQA